MVKIKFYGAIFYGDDPTQTCWCGLKSQLKAKIDEI